MSVIKIVPFPGAPGPTGPTGPTGPASITVTDSTWQPVISGTGFVQSSNPATGTYKVIDGLAFISLNIPFSSVTNFGTGQYTITLPFGTVRHEGFYGGTLHNSGISQFYSLKGHVDANQTAMNMYYISGTGQDLPMDFNSPFILDTTDYLHMSFVYEIAA